MFRVLEHSIRISIHSRRMSRHSKNCTAATHFTYEEKRKAGLGTLRKRLGKDSFTPFGQCALCLGHVVSPLVTPSGYLYCKECIYENLLSQKQQIQTKQELYEKYVHQQEQDNMDQMIQEEKQVLQSFIERSGSSRGDVMTSSSKSTKSRDQIIAALASKTDLETRDEKKQSIKRTSFWLPEYAPEAETQVSKPSDKTVDPMNEREPLRLRQLMPAHLEWSSEEGKTSMPLCAVTRSEVTHQPTVLLRPSGIIVLEECLKDMVLPTMTCPITNMKLRKKDLVYLQMAGTGFSAHNTVVAKKYRPSMT